LQNPSLLRFCQLPPCSPPIPIPVLPKKGPPWPFGSVPGHLPFSPHLLLLPPPPPLMTNGLIWTLNDLWKPYVGVPFSFHFFPPPFLGYSTDRRVFVLLNSPYFSALMSPSFPLCLCLCHCPLTPLPAFTTDWFCSFLVFSRYPPVCHFGRLFLAPYTPLPLRFPDIAAQSLYPHPPPFLLVTRAQYSICTERAFCPPLLSPPPPPPPSPLLLFPRHDRK